MHPNQRTARMQQPPSPAPDTNPLPELSAVSVRTDLPASQRMERFIMDTGNPYRYRCGPVEVQVEFSPSGQPLQKHLEQLLIELKARPTSSS